MRGMVLCLALAASGVSCTARDTAPTSAAAAAPSVTYIPAGPAAPFSTAVRVGTMLYLSGQIGTDAGGQVVPGGIQAETRQTLDNIKRVLDANGSSLDHVVKCTAMLADMKEWAAMNEVYITYFQRHLPARSAFGATGLARDARIELECWATVAS